ncbi:hypothetical protein [Nocardia niwae]|uniref:Uncharacterized protein n=1 Tax=Nocardia niwae TaxID=626084 RepID=A0ABV2XC23_9NOCA
MANRLRSIIRRTAGQKFRIAYAEPQELAVFSDRSRCYDIIGIIGIIGIAMPGNMRFHQSRAIPII